jgi:ribose 5-phosphate isomerase B
MISKDLALEIVRVWLETPFEGGRHIVRLQKLDAPG